jgi:hypothetical protein
MRRGGCSGLCSTEADTSIDRCRPVLGGLAAGSLAPWWPAFGGEWSHTRRAWGERITPRGGKGRALRDEGTDREGRSARRVHELNYLE